jgi:hypothetical protein
LSKKIGPREIGPLSEYNHKLSTYMERVLNFEAVIQHQKNASEQRLTYNFQRKSVEFLRNKILIDVDFKQKIVIGLSPIQANSEYYNLDNRTCLGKYS